MLNCRRNFKLRRKDLSRGWGLGLGLRIKFKLSPDRLENDKVQGLVNK